MHLPTATGPCRSAGPGHRPPAPADPALLADACGWVPVSVFVDLPRQALVLACPSGTRWTGYHHALLALCATLRCPLPQALPQAPPAPLPASPPASPHDGDTPVPLLAAATGHWHARSRLLGLPADPRRSAGRTYLELAAGPLGPCVLGHDAELAAGFAAVTGTPARR